MIPNCMEGILFRGFESLKWDLQIIVIVARSEAIGVSSWHVELESEGLAFNTCRLNFSYWLFA